MVFSHACRRGNILNFIKKFSLDALISGIAITLLLSLVLNYSSDKEAF